MTKYLEDALVRDFPTIFDGTYGINVEDGWEPLIRSVCPELERLVLKHKAEATLCVCGDHFSKHLDHGFGKCTSERRTLVSQIHKNIPDMIECGCPYFIPSHPYISEIQDQAGLSLWIGGPQCSEDVMNICEKVNIKSKTICEKCGQYGKLQEESDRILCLWCCE